MKTKTAKLTAIAAAAAIAVAAFAATQGWAHGPGRGAGPGAGNCAGQSMGYGMMQGGQGMGYGMMHGGQGMGGAGWGNCFAGTAGDLNLTTDQVTKMLEQHLAWRGNERLKVGKVVQTDDDTIVAEIVTVDDSLVHKFAIDRDTGVRRPVK